MAAHGKMRNAVNCATLFSSPPLIRARIRAESRHFLPGEKVTGRDRAGNVLEITRIARGPIYDKHYRGN